MHWICFRLDRCRICRCGFFYNLEKFFKVSETFDVFPETFAGKSLLCPNSFQHLYFRLLKYFINNVDIWSNYLHFTTQYSERNASKSIHINDTTWQGTTFKWGKQEMQQENNEARYNPVGAPDCNILPRIYISVIYLK